MSDPEDVASAAAPLQRTGWPELAAFGYHDVTDDPESSGFRRPAATAYKLTRPAFAAHLAALARCGRRPILAPHVAWDAPGRHLLLTFDDGGSSALAIAETLAERGWQAHFFVISDRLGTSGFLGPRDLRDLRRQGHLVGTHSRTHPTPFRALPTERMLEEWRTSRERIADLLGEPCVTGSVPGGDISPAVLRSAAAAGLEYLFTSEPQTRAREVDGCHVIGRFMPKAATAATRVGALAEFRGWAQARATRSVKNFVRLALPVPYRYYVRWRGRETGAPE